MLFAIWIQTQIIRIALVCLCMWIHVFVAFSILTDPMVLIYPLLHQPMMLRSVSSANWRTASKGKPKKGGNAKQELENRTALADIRVVQRNLVYVTNLSLDIAKEEVRISFSDIDRSWR